MSDLILHHYPMSPFAEKVRLILGCKGLAWRSVPRSTTPQAAGLVNNDKSEVIH